MYTGYVFISYFIFLGK